MIARVKIIFNLCLIFIINPFVYPECIFFKSRNTTFDTSRLEKIPYKKIQFNNFNNTYMLYFSLCKKIEDFPLVYLSGNYLDNLRIVLFKYSSKFTFEPFIFEVDREPFVSSDSLEFIASSKAQCENHQNKNLFLRLHVKISNKEEEPKFDYYDSTKCEFVFSWHTAMLNKNYLSEGCTANFGNSVVDLSPLWKESYYFVKKDENLRIYFNFCGQVKSSECEISETSLFSACVLHNGKKQILVERNATKFNSGKDKSTIDFFNLSNGDFKSIVVPLVCERNSFALKPEIYISHTELKLKISIKNYIFCSLYESCDFFTGNEKYKLPRESNIQIHNEKQLFLLSPCGRLKEDSVWSGGKSRAALINETSFMSLGFTRSVGLLSDPNRKGVEIVFTGGSDCEGTGKKAKTTIKFYCSEEKKRTEPYLNTKLSNNCEFYFNWEDPSFCPVPASIGENCFVRDSKFGYEFDFKFSNSSQEMIISNEGGVFEMNLCGEIKNSCHFRDHVSVCLRKNKQEIILGKKFTQILENENGAIFFTLTGEECKPGIFYQVYINCICDYKASSSSIPVFVKQDSDCIFHFTWNTPKSCLRESSVSCRVKNQNGKTIDLSPLRKFSSNYKIEKDKNSYFLLNVCGSLWYGAEEVCTEGAGACLHENNNYQYLGSVNEDLSVNSNNVVELVYRNPLGFASTLIIFKCTKENKDPVFEGFANSSYILTWETKYACEDFNKSVLNLTEHSYTTPLVHFNDSIHELTTEIPQIADDNNNNRSKNNQTLNEDFSYQSDSKKISCVFSNSHGSFDLSVLGQQNITLKNNKTIFINICNFVKVSNNNCPYAYSCLVNSSKKAAILASNYYPPQFSSDNLLHYKGSNCRESQNYSLSISFRCNKTSGLGFPKFQTFSKDNCTCKIIWETEVICPQEKLSFSSGNCNIYDSYSQNELNLRKIFNSLNKTNVTFNMCSGKDLNPSCKGDVCVRRNGKWISGGVVQDSLINYNFNNSIIILKNGSVCDGEKEFSTKISLYCSGDKEEKDKMEDWTISEKECEISLELRSPLACFSPIPQNASVSLGKIFLSVGVVLIIIVAIISLYLLHRKFGHSWSFRAFKFESLGCDRERTTDELLLYSRDKKEY